MKLETFTSSIKIDAGVEKDEVSVKSAPTGPGPPVAELIAMPAIERSHVEPEPPAPSR